MSDEAVVSQAMIALGKGKSEIKKPDFHFKTDGKLVGEVEMTIPIIEPTDNAVIDYEEPVIRIRKRVRIRTVEIRLDSNERFLVRLPDGGMLNAWGGTDGSVHGFPDIATALQFAATVIGQTTTLYGEFGLRQAIEHGMISHKKAKELYPDFDAFDYE